MDIKNTTKSLTGLFEGNKKLKRFLPQFITVVLIAFVFGFFAYNASVNMDNRGIDFGLRFLGEESSFDIQFSLIEYSGASSYARAYLVGLLNTILVAAIGIFFATIIGVVVGISRLSSNYLIYKVSEWYIEIFRNIPLLLQACRTSIAILAHHCPRGKSPIAWASCRSQRASCGEPRRSEASRTFPLAGPSPRCPSPLSTLRPP